MAISMALLVGLAVLGVALAATGVFALVAYSVDQRAPELAVRLAVGAGPERSEDGAVQGGRFAVRPGGGSCSFTDTRESNHVPVVQVPARDVFTFVTAWPARCDAFLRATCRPARDQDRPLLAMRVQ